MLCMLTVTAYSGWSTRLHLHDGSCSISNESAWYSARAVTRSTACTASQAHRHAFQHHRRVQRTVGDFYGSRALHDGTSPAEPAYHGGEPRPVPLVHMNQSIADIDGSGGEVLLAPVGNKPVAIPSRPISSSMARDTDTLVATSRSSTVKDSSVSPVLLGVNKT